MPFTRQQALDALSSWHPAPVFLEAYATRRLPEDLDLYVGPPEELFLAPETQAPYTRGRIVPILDDGSFGVVTFHDPEARALVQIGVEQPGKTRATFRTWQQYLASLMLRIGESVDDDDQIRRISDLVLFRHADELFELWRGSRGLSHAEYEQAGQAIVSGIRT